MRIALVHDWLVGMRGGEKCLEVLCRLWPHAHLYTLVQDRSKLSPTIAAMSIRPSFLQSLPGVCDYYRYLLPVMPLAIESHRLSGYDLVLSLSHCVAKSVRPPHGVPHICLCFTPMRYAWHMRDAYLDTNGRDQAVTSISRRFAGRWIIPAILDALRSWDRASADRVDQFVAISRTVQRRIKECYGRESVVVYPPVDVNFYRQGSQEREDFYLCVSALVPYKRIDLAIEACGRLGRKLVVIGTGPEERRLRGLAGPRVTFLGWQSDEVIRDHYRRCRALLFPGVEDFGIVPLEAQACGSSVIAVAMGGASETVRPSTASQHGTGILFGPQTCESRMEAMVRFESEKLVFSPDLARENAERYGEARFAREMTRLVETVMMNHLSPA